MNNIHSGLENQEGPWIRSSGNQHLLCSVNFIREVYMWLISRLLTSEPKSLVFNSFHPRLLICEAVVENPLTAHWDSNSTETGGIEERTRECGTATQTRTACVGQKVSWQKNIALSYIKSQQTNDLGVQQRICVILGASMHARACVGKDDCNGSKEPRNFKHTFHEEHNGFWNANAWGGYFQLLGSWVPR